MSTARLLTAMLVVLGLGSGAHASVVRLEITKVEPAGPAHERISGKAHGELDPADPKNAAIADIELAPRNERGSRRRIRRHRSIAQGRRSPLRQPKRRPA